MISRAEYLSIRGEHDFLYRYFIKCGGMKVAPQLFKTALAKWLAMKGMRPQQGIQQILKDLDQKFG